MSSDGQRWGQQRRTPRSAFIVKRRETVLWTTQVRGLKIQGTRRVKRKTAWQSMRQRQGRQRQRTHQPWGCRASDQRPGVRVKNIQIPTIEGCEHKLGEKAAAWKARCYEISCAIVAKVLPKGSGEAIYGHWTGPVHPESHFAERSKTLPFIPHGWILLTDGRIIDPTRWVFEAVEPYLFVAEEPDYHLGMASWPYDEGGNRWQAAQRRPPPKPKAREKRVAFGVRGDVATFVSMLLNQLDATRVTIAQIFWLANQPYQTLAVGDVKSIYEAICKAGQAAAIPLDNAHRARRELGFKP